MQFFSNIKTKQQLTVNLSPAKPGEQQTHPVTLINCALLVPTNWNETPKSVRHSSGSLSSVCCRQRKEYEMKAEQKK